MGHKYPMQQRRPFTLRGLVEPDQARAGQDNPWYIGAADTMRGGLAGLLGIVGDVARAFDPNEQALGRYQQQREIDAGFDADASMRRGAFDAERAMTAMRQQRAQQMAKMEQERAKQEQEMQEQKELIGVLSDDVIDGLLIPAGTKRLMKALRDAGKPEEALKQLMSAQRGAL